MDNQQVNNATRALPDVTLRALRDCYFSNAHKRAELDCELAAFYHAMGVLLDDAVTDRRGEVDELHRMFYGDCGAGKFLGGTR